MPMPMPTDTPDIAHLAELAHMIGDTLDALAPVDDGAPAEGDAIDFHDELGRPQVGTIRAILPDGRMDVRTDNDVDMTIARRQVRKRRGGGAEAQAVVGPNGAMAHARRARARKRTATRFAAQPQIAVGGP